jgi:outer membrane protein TolC
MKESQMPDMSRKSIQKSILFFMILIMPVILHAGQPNAKQTDAEQTETQQPVTNQPNSKPAPPVYSLEELYKLALKRSELIKIAENQLYVAEKDVDRAFSTLVPTFSAYGDYIRYDKDGLTQPKSAQVYGVKLKQKFTVNGREFIILGSAKDTVRQREYDLDTIMEENLFTVASAYFDIANKQKRVEILKENVKRISTQKEAVLIKLKLEEVLKTALLRTEAELSGARSDLVQAENALVYAYTTLARSLEIPSAYEIITPDLDDDAPLDGHFEKYIETALDQRSDIKSLEMNVKLAKDYVDIIKSEYWPTLSFEAGYKNQDTDPSYLTEKETAYGSVNLNMVLFDWGFRSASVSQEKARLRNTELQLKAKSKEVALEVERAYLTIITAQSAIAALKDKLRFSRADYAAVSLQFKVGQADNLDILDSNTVLHNSERELSEAQYMLALAKIGLERAQGVFLKSVKAQLE